MSLATWKATAQLRAFGFWKIPLLAYVRPQVLENSLDRFVVKIPLRHRTKNHWNSMYFGALAIGADCAGGFLTLEHIRASGQKISLVFKDFKAEFLKRPESDVHFTCEDRDSIAALVAKTLASGERQNGPIVVTATCPKKSGEEPVARFVLTVSLKKQ